MEKEQFWNKIVWYNFILCMLVVLIHSENTDAFFDAVPVLNQLEAFLVQKIAQIAIGGFFLCSGYLFYRNFSWNKLGEKWKKRFKSIVIPYVLWNVLYYLINYMITKIPFLSSLYPKTVTFSWNELVQAAFFYKYNAEFWFIQCLIVYICICPLIYLLIRNKWTGIAAIACVLLLTGDQIMFPYKELISHMINWLFLYMIGAYAGIHLALPDRTAGSKGMDEADLLYLCDPFYDRPVRQQAGCCRFGTKHVYRDCRVLPLPMFCCCILLLYIQVDEQIYAGSLEGYIGQQIKSKREYHFACGIPACLFVQQFSLQPVAGI